VGKFMAFDKHMNIVLGDCEEFRRIPVRGGKGEEQEQRRTLGLVILRGESVVSLTVESKPPAEDKKKAGAAGPGMGVPGGRGCLWHPWARRLLVWPALREASVVRAWRRWLPRDAAA